MIYEFRAWDIDKKVMRYDICIDSRGNELYIQDGYIAASCNSEIMMKSPFEDVNRRQLWEGDIIRTSLDLCIIEFEDGAFYAKYVNMPIRTIMSELPLGYKYIGHMYEAEEVKE